MKPSSDVEKPINNEREWDNIPYGSKIEDAKSVSELLQTTNPSLELRSARMKASSSVELNSVPLDRFQSIQLTIKLDRVNNSPIRVLSLP